MKGMRKNGILTALLIGSLAVMFPQGAGASTLPCTQISNQATLSYSVGAVAQTPITSTLGAGNQFYVGVKVLVTVLNQDGSNVPVTAGTTPTVLTFTVTNDGNAVHDYALTYQAAANGVASPHGGGNDSFDGNTVAVYVENGLQAGYQASGANQDTATSIDNLARDGGARTVYIVYTPSDLTAPNGSLAVYYLTATTQWADGSAIGAQGTQTPTLAQAGGACDGTRTVDVVFGDADGPSTADAAARDAIHSDDSAYIVASAAIGVTKSYTIRWDPINYGTSPKAIPGAIVEYSIGVANTGGTAAILTTISDTLDVANLTLVSTFYDGGFGTAAPTSTTSRAFIVTCGAGCGARACEGAGGTSFTALTADGIVFATPTITATMGTVLPSEDSGACAAGSLGASDTVTIKFQATIN